MASHATITPGMMTALKDISLGKTVSNTMGRKLSKLGWVSARVTKVYGAEPHKIYNYRITHSGRAALQCSN
jgi:hypothetical protein